MAANFTVNLSQEFVPPTGGEMIAEFKIDAAGEATNNVRRHLVICLDRSGSMDQVEKIGQAKKGAKSVVDELGEEDQLSLITFAEVVNTEFRLNEITESNRQKVKSTIEDVDATGSTHLGEALEQAHNEFKTAGGDQEATAKRILLLSDGEDTSVYFNDVESFASVAEALSGDGISVMAAGIGQQYNREVISEIGLGSEGSWTHIEDSEEILKFFEGEVEQSKGIVAIQPELQLDLAAEVGVEEAYRGAPQVKRLNLEQSEDTVTVPLPDLHQEQTITVSAKFSIPPKPEGRNEFTIATATLRSGDRLSKSLEINYTQNSHLQQAENAEVTLAYQDRRLRTAATTDHLSKLDIRDEVRRLKEKYPEYRDRIELLETELQKAETGSRSDIEDVSKGIVPYDDG